MFASFFKLPGPIPTNRIKLWSLVSAPERTAQLTSSHRTLNRCSAMNRQDWALCFRNNLVNCSSVHMRRQPPCRLRSQDDQIGAQLPCDMQDPLCRDPLLDHAPGFAPQLGFRRYQLAEFAQFAVGEFLPTFDHMQER